MRGKGRREGRTTRNMRKCIAHYVPMISAAAKSLGDGIMLVLDGIDVGWAVLGLYMYGSADCEHSTIDTYGPYGPFANVEVEKGDHQILHNTR